MFRFGMCCSCCDIGLVKLHHPDKNNNNPTAKDTTRELIEAYKHLKNLAITAFIDEKQEQEARKIFEEDEDIFTIWDTCSECNGLGKVKHFGSSRTEACPDCDPVPKDYIVHPFIFMGGVKASGIKTLKCKYCDNGKFKLRNGRIVDCRVCNGTGIWKRVKCRTCGGFGYVFKEAKILATCSKCNGLGKIQVNPFNPVIRKGSILV